MQELLSAVPDEFKPFAVVIFVLAGAVGIVLTFLRGHKKGPEQPTVKEFALTGQMADMGPIREMIENQGLLYQQQIRTNIHLESLAEVASQALEAHMKRLQEEHIEDEVERRLKARESAPRRAAPRS